jgi:hypothetical protein
MESAPSPGITTVECGQRFQPPGASGATLAADFPPSVTPGQPVLSGSVELTSGKPLRGVTSPAADVFVVRDGRVVGLPLPQDAVGMLLDLGPGVPKSVPAYVPLTSCESGEPLTSGTYELYARLVVVPDDGAVVESFGGPWQLQVT